MATKVNPPSALRSATWYPQFQEIGASISLPANKRFGITKRVYGISAASLLSKVTNIRSQYPDVNNGAIPYDNTWVTLRVAEVGAIQQVVTKNVNTSIANGQTLVEQVSAPGITTNNIVATYNHSGVSATGSTQSYEFYNGLGVNITIPSNGTVRFELTNNSGSTINLPNKVLFAEIFKPKQDIGQSAFNYGVRKGTPVFSEFAENGIPYPKVEEVYDELYKVVKGNDSSVQTPADTEIFGDYFEALNGYSTDVQFGASGNSFNDYRNIMSSQSNARGTSAYYSNGAYNYRNRVVTGYFDGIRIMLDGSGLFSQIFNMERAFMAMSDRKVGVFGWGAFEGVGHGVDAQHWQRLPLPGGDLITLNRAQGSYNMTEQQAFFTMLFGNTYLMWHDNAQYGTDINCWTGGYIGGEDSWKTRWQPTGGSEVEYNKNSPGHPQRPSNCVAGFSDSAADNLNGAFSGIYLYDQIKTYANTKVKYATFGYTDNGGAKSGYASGNTPIQGAKGDASINCFNNSNVGQYNIVNQFEGKKPLVYEAIGSGGTAIIILNLWAGMTESITYSVTTQNSGIQNITHVGAGLGVYKV